MVYKTSSQDVWEYASWPVSVRDLIELDAVPKAEKGGCWRNHKAQKYINITHLAGIMDVPGINDVRRLCFRDNRIETIPEGLNLRFLIGLDLSGNRIKSLPFLNLPYLERLDLSRNQLQEFNAEMHELPDLKKLFLQGNKIKRISSVVLRNCRVLNLEGNELESMPRMVLWPDFDKIKVGWRGNPLLSVAKDFDQSRLPETIMSAIKEDIETNKWPRRKAKAQTQIAACIRFVEQRLNITEDEA